MGNLVAVKLVTFEVKWPEIFFSFSLGILFSLKVALLEVASHGGQRREFSVFFVDEERTSWEY